MIWKIKQNVLSEKKNKSDILPETKFKYQQLLAKIQKLQTTGSCDISQEERELITDALIISQFFRAETKTKAEIQ